MSPEAAAPIKQQVAKLLETKNAGILSFGLLITIYAASRGMSMTIVAIDKAYDIENSRPFYKQLPLSLLLTIIVATLIVLVLLLLPVGTAVVFWLKKQGEAFGWTLYLVNVTRYALAVVLMFAVLAIVYHFGPSFKQKFVAVTPGAIFTVAVWLLLGLSFKLYLTKLGGAASYAKTYGAVAGAAILLLFFFLDAVVMLIGAEINSEIDMALGRSAKQGELSVPDNPDSVKPA
jgi:membrane protein